MIYDYPVIGGGIAGATAAYELAGEARRDGYGIMMAPAFAALTAKLCVAIPISQHAVFVDALSSDRLP